MGSSADGIRGCGSVVIINGSECIISQTIWNRLWNVEEKNAALNKLLFDITFYQNCGGCNFDQCSGSGGSEINWSPGPGSDQKYTTSVDNLATSRIAL
jgi:hypothetical protein